MNFDRQNPARHVSIAKFDVPAELICFCQFIESTKLKLPGKALRIAIRLGKNGNEDEALEFGFETFVNVVGFE